MGSVPIGQFRGQYRFLSNFQPGTVVLDDAEYSSTEHAYQAAKTLNFTQRQQIQAAQMPALAKKLGGGVDLRPDWESVKYGVMLDLVRQKFTKHADLGQRLLDTKDAILIEGNTWHDLVWGICTCIKHNNTGTNWLGEILMRVRSELKALTPTTSYPF